MDDALRFMEVVLVVLWIALFVAVGVFVLAGVWILARAISTRLERRYLSNVARWSRRRASLAEDAGPWACPACSSVNASTVARCYLCDVPRPAEARELADAAADPSVFRRPEPVSRFDPGLYRGPGAPAVAAALGAGPSALGAAPPAPAAGSPEAPVTDTPAR